MILAIDTTREFGSLALMRGGELVEEVVLHSPEGFSQILFGQIERLLERHGCRVNQIECFAAASGPGSFTGVRVGLACVKGLAAASGRPVVAVSCLKALAACGARPLRATVIDARRDEVYGALYDAELTPVLPETVAKFPAWLQSLPDAELEFVSTDFSPFRPAIVGTRFAAALITESHALAAAVARVAHAELQTGRVQDPADVDANYVRRSDAELLWKD